MGAAIAAAAWILHGRYGRESSFQLLAGSAVGVILQRSRLCFTAAFRDLFLTKNRRAMLGVLAALAAGSVGCMVVFGAWIPFPEAGYLPAKAHIAPVQWHLLLGGATFGLGMVLAGGCISGSLYRLGEGSLVAPVTLAGTIAGFWLGFLCWNGLYTSTVADAPVVWLPRHLGYAGALALQLAALAGIAAFLLRKFPALPRSAEEPLDLRRASRKLFEDPWPAPMGGVALAAVATFALLRTEPLGVTSELGRLARLSGQAFGFLPARLEGLDHLRGCGAIIDGSNGAIFLMALVAGSLAAALASGEFRVRGGRPRTFALAAAGGVLMGFGAMISLGCTVGTLLSGIMAFSLSGWVFGIGLLGGAWGGAAILRRLA